MKKVAALVICVACAGCFDKSDEQIRNDAHDAVIKEISKFNSDEPCKSMVFNKKAMFGEKADEAFTTLCGDKFNTSKDVKISDLKVYSRKEEVACGIISGTSRAGKPLKTDFIYKGSSEAPVSIRPITVRYADKELPKIMIQALNAYERFKDMSCK